MIEAQLSSVELTEDVDGGSSVVLVRLEPIQGSYIDEQVSPSKILWARVILRALYDYVKWKDSTKMKDRRDFQCVKRWLFEPSDLGNSLENLCRFLGWPVGMIRERARTMTRDDVKKLEFREREPTLLDNG